MSESQNMRKYMKLAEGSSFQAEDLRSNPYKKPEGPAYDPRQVFVRSLRQMIGYMDGTMMNVDKPEKVIDFAKDPELHQAIFKAMEKHGIPVPGAYDGPGEITDDDY